MVPKMAVLVASIPQFVLGGACLLYTSIKAQYATYDNRSIDYIDQKKENGVRQQYTFVDVYKRQIQRQDFIITHMIPQEKCSGVTR